MSLLSTLLRRLLSTAILAAGIASAFAPAARADDPAPAGASTAVSQLTADEFRFVRSRMPDWDRKDAAEQERVAVNVLRIRNLPPEMKQRFLERARRVDAAGLGSAFGPRIDQFSKRPPEERREIREGNRFSRAVVAAVLSGLSAPAKAVLDPSAVPAVLEVPERYAFEACAFDQWRRRVGEHLVEHPEVDAEPSPAAPPPLSETFVTARDAVRAQGGAKAPKDLRMKFAVAYAQDRMRAALRSVPPPEPQQTPETRQAHERVLSTAIRTAFPEAYDAVLTELSPVVAAGHDSIVTWCREHSPERATPRNGKLLEAVIAIERSREFLTGPIRTMAEQLQSAILREIKLTDAELDDALRLDTDRSGSRFDRLQKIKARFGGGFGWFLNGSRRGFGDRRGAPGGPPPTMDK